MSGLFQDLKYGLRMLARNPGFTAVAVLTLALGIGANTAIFSVLKALLLQPLPYPEPDRLMAVWATPLEAHWYEPLQTADYLDWKERSTSFEELGVQRLGWANISGDAHPQRLRASICTASFLRALGVKPTVGRLFTDGEEAQGERVALLSDGLWKRRFGADPGIVGRQITINRESYTVLGIMPKDYETPRPWPADSGAELWLPLRFSPDDLPRGRFWLYAIGRLKPGISKEVAAQELSGIAAALAEEYPDTNTRVGAWMLPLVDFMMGQVRRPLWFLLAAVGVLLLICCANVASILFARSSVRQPEVAIRASLGAGRARVFRQFLTESLVLSVTGGIAGVLLAWWGVEALRAMIPPTIQRTAGIQIDGWVLLFSIGVSLLTGLLFGLAPALSASRLDISSVLRAGQGTLTTGPSRARFQSILVVGQFALVLVLANSAALMLKSYLNVIGTPLALDTKRVLAVGITLQGRTYEDSAEAQGAFWKRLLERVRAIPGVGTASGTTKLPLEGGTNGSFLVEGEVHDRDARRPLVERSWVTPEYFAAAGIPLLAGRVFTPGDLTGTQFGIVVNRAFAQQYWPGETALGRHVYPDSPTREWSAVIVGMVEDVPQWGLERPALPEIYFPFENTSRSTRHLIIRAGVAPLTLAHAVREAVASIDPDQPVSNIRTLEEVFDNAAARRRFDTLLIQLFALVALVMVMVGIYGVNSYYVAQRTREIGIRVALGAEKGSVMKMVLGRAIKLSALGIVIGAGGALALSGIVGSMLHGISPTDPVTITSVGFLLALMALLGSALPARRATKVDPMVALRYE